MIMKMNENCLKLLPIISRKTSDYGQVEGYMYKAKIKDMLVSGRPTDPNFFIVISKFIFSLYI